MSSRKDSVKELVVATIKRRDDAVARARLSMVMEQLRKKSGE